MEDINQDMNQRYYMQNYFKLFDKVLLIDDNLKSWTGFVKDENEY